MEKASTPRSRLTRSAAKQVNSSSKKTDQAESLEKSPVEDVKQNVRKSRRKVENVTKTNGDTSATNVNSKKIKNREEFSDGSGDGSGLDSESEHSNISSLDSSSNHITSGISRKSLRIRRSITPGPEEPSASKKMKRSTSEGKLDATSQNLPSTPTCRRSTRAKSESKDFVFTPTKTRDKISSLLESSSKHIHRNSTLRVIDKIIETNEEDTSQDEGESHSQKKKSPMVKKQVDSLVQINNEPEETSSTSKDVCTTDEPETINIKETNNADKTNKENNDSNQILTTQSPVIGEPPEKPRQDLIHLEPVGVESKQDKIDIGDGHEDTNHLDTDAEPLVCKPESGALQSPQASIGRTGTNLAIKELSKPLEKQESLEGSDGVDMVNDDSESVALSHWPRLKPLPSENSLKSDALLNSKDQVEKVLENSLSVTLSQGNNMVENNSLELVNNEKAVVDQVLSSKSDKSECKEFLAQSKSDSLNVSGEAQEFPKQIVDAVEEVEDIAEPMVVNEPGSEPLTEESEIACVNVESLDNIQNKDCNTSLEVSGQKKENTPEITGKLDDGDLKDDIKVSPNSKQCTLNLQEVLIEDSGDNSPVIKAEHFPPSYSDTTIEEEEECYGIQIESSHAISGTGESSVEFKTSVNPLELCKQSLSTAPIEETNTLDKLSECGEVKSMEKKDETIVSTLCKEDEPSVHGLNDSITICSDTQLQNNFQPENDSDVKQIEVDSGSDSDIYKDMSDFGTDDGKKDDQLFDDTASSGSRRGSCESEEYISSFEGEEVGEEEEDEEDNDVEDEEEQEEPLVKENLSSNSDKKGQITSLENITKTGEKMFDMSTPMTYDKALAILNKNREKKIDDEEFFDMFTQELNRVSEESDSDSDIAIVDEYIMEPEEPAVKKLSQKPNNPQIKTKSPTVNQKIASQPNQSIPPAEHFGVSFNQVTSQHNHPGMSFSQGGMYHQYNQGMIPPVNAVRGPIMYDQFGQSVPTNVPDPRIFTADPHDVNFSTGGMFSHSLSHVSEAPLHYSSGSGLKVRNVNTMNPYQPPIVKNPNYSGNEQPSSEVNYSSRVDLDTKIKNRWTSAATMTESDGKQGSVMFSKPAQISSGNGSTPILDLLGLDKEKLRLLKQALGLKSQKKNLLKKSAKGGWLTKKCSLDKSNLMRPHKIASISKTKRRRTRRSKEFFRKFNYDILKQILENNSTAIHKKYMESCTELSSGETANLPGRAEHYNERSDNPGRKVNIEDDSVIVTIMPNRHRVRRRRHTKKSKRAVSTSSESSPDRLKLKKHCRRNTSVSSSESLDTNQKTKMTRTKSKPALLKSNCGTFTVDPLTATSQSSDSVSQDEESYLEEVRRSLKNNLASGKNKLSNLFSERLFQKSRKGLKRKAKETSSDESEECVQKVNKIERLPAELLKKLTKGGNKNDEFQEVEDSDKEKKKRKRRRKKNTKFSVKNAAVEEAYIPCVTPGATQFSLSRLDKSGVLVAAERAAKFRTEHLYGSAVKRITIMDFKG